jgi:hypothetical protein
MPVVCLLLSLILYSCSINIADYEPIEQQPLITPDYSNVTLPCNIAPPNFRIDSIDRYTAFFVAGADSFSVSGSRSRSSASCEVFIPANKWRRLLTHHKGDTLRIKIYAQLEYSNLRYPDITITISEHHADPYLVYRLIEPGYEFWGQMGIYQRNIESFSETPLLVNSLTDGGCMNCHAFCNNNPSKFLFHLRAEHAGTVIVNDDKLQKINTKTADMLAAAVYPRWHPNGRYVAFSVNKTFQRFHSTDPNLIEVYDEASDLVIYDVETATMHLYPLLSDPQTQMTFPEWSPDGNKLYFCCANAPLPSYKLQYSICSIDFDPANASIGAAIDTVLAVPDKSAAFPRIHPDGRYMLLCLADCGAFPIWHKSNDLYLLDLANNTLREATELNSPESDSYHSWSSDGNWIVFSSRRLDALYTRPFLAHFTPSHFSPPFLLPQRTSHHYAHQLKSYNIPEFLSTPIPLTRHHLQHIARSKPQPISQHKH